MPSARRCFAARRSRLRFALNLHEADNLFRKRGAKRVENASGKRIMKLNPAQIKAFDEQGYVFFPNCFSEEEIALLRDDAEAILKLDRQEVWREKTGAPRTAFAAHTFNETFRLLASHPPPL